MYFIIALIAYALSIVGSIYLLFNYTKYAERLHVREKCRMVGIAIKERFQCSTYDVISDKIISQTLVLSEMATGLLEGLLGLNPLIQLCKPTIITNEVIKEIPKEVIIEKIIEVPKKEYIYEKVYDDEKIIAYLKNLLVPDIKCINYERNNNKTVNSTEPMADSIFISKMNDLMSTDICTDDVSVYESEKKIKKEIYIKPEKKVKFSVKKIR